MGTRQIKCVIRSMQANLKQLRTILPGSSGDPTSIGGVTTSRFWSQLMVSKIEVSGA